MASASDAMRKKDRSWRRTTIRSRVVKANSATPTSRKNSAAISRLANSVSTSGVNSASLLPATRMSGVDRKRKSKSAAALDAVL